MNQELPWGATPIEDSSGLKLPWVRSRSQLNEVEAENILKALHYFSRRIFPLQWFNEQTLKKIHLNMFSNVWDWAGLYYRGPLRNLGVHCMHIPVQVRMLCEDVQFWLTQRTEMTFLEQCAHIHFRLAAIHPFTNGNGRHARYVADLYLHSLLGQRPHWPEAILMSGTNLRTEYIQSLQLADRGDSSALIRLIVRYGGKNPNPSDVRTHTSFKKHFAIEKLEETLSNLSR